MGFTEAFSHVCIMYMTLFISACLSLLPTSQVPFYFHVVCVGACAHICVTQLVSRGLLPGARVCSGRGRSID